MARKSSQEDLQSVDLMKEVESLDPNKHAQGFFDELNCKLGEIEGQQKLKAIQERLKKQKEFIQRNLQHILLVESKEYLALQDYILAVDSNEESARSKFQQVIDPIIFQKKNKRAWKEHRVVGIELWKLLKEKNSSIFPGAATYFSSIEIQKIEKSLHEYDEKQDYTQEKEITIAEIKLLRKKSDQIKLREEIEQQCLGLYRENKLDMSKAEKETLQKFLTNLKFEGDFDAEKFVLDKLEWVKNEKRKKLIEQWDKNFDAEDEDHRHYKRSYLKHIHNHKQGEQSLKEIEKLIERLKREKAKPTEDKNTKKMDVYIKTIGEVIKKRAQQYEGGNDSEKKRLGVIAPVSCVCARISQGYNKLKEMKSDFEKQRAILELYKNILDLSFSLGFFRGTLTDLTSTTDLTYGSTILEEESDITEINRAMCDLRKEVIRRFCAIGSNALVMTIIGMDQLINFTEKRITECQAILQSAEESAPQSTPQSATKQEQEKQMQIVKSNLTKMKSLIVEESGSATTNLNPLQHKVIKSYIKKVSAAVNIFEEKAKQRTPHEEAYVMHAKGVIRDMGIEQGLVMGPSLKGGR